MNGDGEGSRFGPSSVALVGQVVARGRPNARVGTSFHLRRKGTPIPTNELWIAASAAQHGLMLLTLDHHFKEVPQILLEYFEPIDWRPPEEG
jgi:hypothetical protein